ncbi:MAG: response regulator [Anaerolineae bacterium]|nr:response regulator [Anaerolineae bacterium]
MSEILIVEDDRPILGLLTKMLERAGYAVTAEPDGSAALDYLKENQPDLIMLDLSLGCSLNGVDLLRYITEAPHLAECVIVIVSANPKLPPDFYQSNRIARIITKPVRPTNLIPVIESLLKEKV